MVRTYRSARLASAVTIALIVLLPLTVLADGPVKAKKVTVTEVQVAEKAPVSPLEKIVPAFEMKDTKLSDFVQYLRDTVKLNIYVQWKLLSDLGIEAEESISVSMRNVKVGTILRLVLHGLGEGHEVTAELQDGVIVIAPVAYFEKERGLVEQRRLQDATGETTDTKRLAGRIGLLKQMREVCSNPGAMAVLALDALRDEVSWEEVSSLVFRLESLASKAKSPVVLNAIRLTLKEIYVEQGKTDKLEVLLIQMVLDNDGAVVSKPRTK